MSRKVNTTQAHLNRTDRFRYEQDFTTLLEALTSAQHRSLGTFKVITVMERLGEGLFTVQSHGVDTMGCKDVARFKRGVLIWDNGIKGIESWKRK